MKSVILVTVMHTGTNTFKAHSRDLGYRADHTTKLRRVAIDNIAEHGFVYSTHVWPTTWDNADEETWKAAVFYGLPIITMYRDENEIEASWRRRGEPLSQMRKQIKRWRADIAPKSAAIVDLASPAEGLAKVSDITGVDWGSEFIHHENKS